MFCVICLTARESGGVDVVIRAISDKPDSSHPVEFDTFKKEAVQNCIKIMKDEIQFTIYLLYNRE